MRTWLHAAHGARAPVNRVGQRRARRARRAVATAATLGLVLTAGRENLRQRGGGGRRLGRQLKRRLGLGGGGRGRGSRSRSLGNRSASRKCRCKPRG